jgi:broad specificity phosphatase PhoE
MKREFILMVVAVASFISVSAQQKLTTFILLRHAEKVNDGSKNPNLTEAGKKRAEGLVSIFKNTPIRAIYSTSFLRTRETVGPLAKARSLEMKEYEAFKPEPIDKILADFGGETVLVCGHSNNIPWIANYLTGTKKFKNFEDNDYSNVLIITVAERGKVASVTWLSY